MSAPYVLQLVFGQPKVGLVFHQDDSGSEGRLLTISFSNPPINNRLLQAFRVTRLPAQDVFLAIRIFTASTKEVVADTFMPEIKVSPSDKARRIILPPSILMANVNLVRWQRSTNSAVLFANRVIPLQEGTYIVTIRIEIDGKGKIWKPALLHIGKTEADMVWEKEITDKYLI